MEISFKASKEIDLVSIEWTASGWMVETDILSAEESAF